MNNNVEVVETVSKFSVPFWVYIVAAVLGAVAMGISIYIYSERKKRIKPFEELVDKQIVVDLLGLKDVGNWAMESKGKVSPGTKALFFYPSKKTVNGFGYTYPSDLDPTKHIIGAIADEKSGQLIRITLFSFNTMEDGLKERLTNGNDVFAVEY